MNTVKVANAGGLTFATIEPEWEESGPDETPWGRLSTRTCIVVCGQPLHLEAICVEEIDGNQDGSPGAWPGDYEHLQAIYGDAPYLSFTHTNGRRYTAYAMPFCD